MKPIILDAEQFEDISFVQSLFDGSMIVALDTTLSIFNRIHKQIDKPKNYLQGFATTNVGYLYYHRPDHTDKQTADHLLVKMHVLKL